MRTTLVLFVFCSGLFFSCGEDENTSICAVPLLVESLQITDTSAEISWLQSVATSFLITYQPTEDLPIEEVVISTTETAVVLIDLLPNTTYEVRVQAFCDEESTSFSEEIIFTTEATSCTPPTESAFEVLDYNEVFVAWDENITSTAWEVEYGLGGFNLGEGIIKPTNESQILLDALIVGTTYDYYIKSFCEAEESAYSEVRTFTTEACEIPTNFEVFNVTANSVTFNWNAEGQEVWEFEYGLENFVLGTGMVFFTDTIPTTIESLEAGTRYDFYLRANCGPNGRSEYVGPILIETLL